MFKLIGKIIRLFVFILILAVIFHNWTAKFLLTTGLRIALGAPVKVEEVKINFSDVSVLFGNIEIANPSSFFSEAPLAKIPKIFIDASLSSLWEGKIHFEAIELNIQELHVIRERDGRINLLSLKTLEPKSQSQSQTSRQKSEIPLHFQIDQVILSLGQARYTDLTGPNPVEKGVNLRINRATYKNMDGLEDIVKVISWETLKRIGFGNLTAFLGDWNPNWGSSSGNILEKTISAIRQKF